MGGGAKVQDVTLGSFGSLGAWFSQFSVILVLLVSCDSVSSQFLFSQFRIVLVRSVLSVLYSLGYWVLSSLSSWFSQL